MRRQGVGMRRTREGNGDVPATYEELAALVRARLPQLSRSHRRIAERVLADPEGVAFSKGADVAAALDVNESTVVRFATALGLDGYPHLVQLCRDKLSAEAQLLRRFSQASQVAGRTTDPLELAAQHDQANVARTLARVDRRQWRATVRALSKAPQVHVLGLRKCHTVAFLLAYLLGMVRDGVDLMEGTAGTLVEDLRRVRRGDCFVAVAIHRYSRDTVLGFEWAKSQGATTVALTDNAGSPLVALADHTFYVDTTGVAVLRSMTAFVALAQTLANGVATERGADTDVTLRAEESLLGQFDVYE